MLGLLMAFAPVPRDLTIREDVLAAMQRTGYTHKAAAIDADLSPSHWTEQLATGSIALWRLERLSPAFRAAFYALRAARLGKVVVDAPDAHVMAAVTHLRAVLGVPLSPSAAPSTESCHA